jgi:hypothetical protein
MEVHLVPFPAGVASLSDYLSLLEGYAFIVLIVLLVVLGTVYKIPLLQAIFSGGNSSQESRTNCPTCGARTTVEPGVCDYCDESLT